MAKPSSKSNVQRSKSKVRYPEQPERIHTGSPLDGITLRETDLTTETQSTPSSSRSATSASLWLKPVFSDSAHGIFLYHGNCLAILDAIAGKYPDGCFDMIFADPPYFLSNGGITCHAGRMVSVHKGDWDKSKGPEENHNFRRRRTTAADVD